MSENSLSRAIGVIGKPHGIKGYVFVRMFTDYPNTINTGSILFLDEGCHKSIKIEDIRFINSGGSNRTIFKFDAAEDKNGAEQLRDLILYRSIKSQPDLKKGTFWIDDLNGCRIFLMDGSFFGVVTSVASYASNDNLTIAKENKGIIIVPMIEEYIESIDTDNKKIVLKKIPEYI